MTAVSKVAIAGSGVAGLAAAIQLAKAGVEVDVFESKPELSALGSGITLQGNALRVFDALGAWDDIVPTRLRPVPSGLTTYGCRTDASLRSKRILDASGDHCGPTELPPGSTGCAFEPSAFIT